MISARISSRIAADTDSVNRDDPRGPDVGTTAHHPHVPEHRRRARRLPALAGGGGSVEGLHGHARVQRAAQSEAHGKHGDTAALRMVLPHRPSDRRRLRSGAPVLLTTPLGSLALPRKGIVSASPCIRYGGARSSGRGSTISVTQPGTHAPCVLPWRPLEGQIALTFFSALWPKRAHVATRGKRTKLSWRSWRRSPPAVPSRSERLPVPEHLAIEPRRGRSRKVERSHRSETQWKHST